MQQNCTYSIRIGIQISQDLSQNVICTVIIDAITSIQRVITTKTLNISQITNPYTSQMKNIKVQTSKRDYASIYLTINSNLPTLIYKIYANNNDAPTLMNLDSNLINLQNLQLQKTYDPHYQFQFGIQKPSIVYSTEKYYNEISRFSYLYNPCGDYYQNIQYVENDAFYLVKCTLQTGNFFFAAVYFTKNSSFNYIEFVKSDQYFANNLQDQSQIKTITKTVNQNLIYVLEIQQGQALNQMTLYKVKFYDNTIQIETVYFETDLNLTFTLGAFFIQNDLIAAVTEKYILGFSVLKGSLIYRFQLDTIPNLSLIDVSQVYSTLLFTYAKDTNPVTYETYQVDLSLLLMSIDMTQIQVSPLYFSVREQENPFQQIINFKIYTLSPTKPTTTLAQNQLNIYQIIQQSMGSLVNLDIEKYIFGSNLQLNINLPSTSGIQIEYEMTKQAKLISKVQLETKDLLQISSTYIEDIFIGIYQSNDEQQSLNLKLIKLSKDSDDMYNFIVIDEIKSYKGSIQKDINGIICIYIKQLVSIFLPISYNQTYILGIISFQYENIFQSFSIDPINQYLLFSAGISVKVNKYFPDQINKSNRYAPSSQLVNISNQKNNILSLQYNPQNNIVYYTDNEIIYS
ncbi:hypothetical protein ABPG72_017065, partial [Tetrahymena utriculariae]